MLRIQLACMAMGIVAILGQLLVPTKSDSASPLSCDIADLASVKGKERCCRRGYALCAEDWLQEINCAGVPPNNLDCLYPGNPCTQLASEVTLEDVCSIEKNLSCSVNTVWRCFKERTGLCDNDGGAWVLFHLDWYCGCKLGAGEPQWSQITADFCTGTSVDC